MRKLGEEEGRRRAMIGGQEAQKESFYKEFKRGGAEESSRRILPGEGATYTFDIHSVVAITDESKT